MNFMLDPADQEFRDSVREFIASALSRERFEYEHSPDAVSPQWTRVLAAKGWLVPHWPKQWGGTDWTPVRRGILQEELCAAGCPPTDRVAVDMVGPIICAYGSDEQKQRYLPRILSAEDVWCQGFSEPQCGSDVTAVKTRAVRSAGGYVVSGQKLWISRAHQATMMFALVRVSVGNTLQKGLSFLLIDMRSPGIEVRPVITIDGRHVVNEVFFNAVQVPRQNLIGEEEKGWLYARALLANERSLIAGIPAIKRLMGVVAAMLSSGCYRGQAIAIDPLLQARFTQLQIDLSALEFLMLRVLHADAGDASIDALTSVLKLKGAEMNQRAHDLMMEALGERGLVDGVPLDPAEPVGEQDEHIRRVVADFLYSRSASIAGGTNEIQRNLIAAIGLGL